MSMPHSAESARERGRAVLFDNYARFPLRPVRGEGTYVYDEAGRKYLDFTSGIGVLSLGHVPDAVAARLKRQLATLWHTSNVFESPLQEAVAARLVRASFADRVLFVNSGTEANEAAIKLVRRYARDVRGIEGGTIVAFERSFHGRTMGALSATGQPALHDGFGPMLPGFRFLPYNDTASLQAIDAGTIAVILELVQGEGGVTPADESWVQALVARARAHQALIVVDEVQTGMGRTGTLFAYQQYGFEPDVMTLAKGLGSGFPIGALLAKEAVARVFTPGTHGSTFGGGALAMAAAEAVLTIIDDPAFLAHVRQKGEALLGGLRSLASGHPDVGVRGRGLLLGLSFPEGARRYVDLLREEGVLVLTAGTNVMRILPPLTVSDEEIAAFLDALDRVLQKRAAEKARPGER
ncbi:MAG: acetylornithine/succinylornithine family transaminase [Hydrogenibacillus sp.]|nr:acetylornithine/succinylornithine family transaminase [Hydrogenibacillus sp.]